MLDQLRSSVSTPDPRTSNPATVCVFCGSSPGKSPAHLAAARSLAQAMHANGVYLVYGGGTVGLMGELSRTLVSLSGPAAVHGIIPAPLMEYEQSDNDPEDGYVPEETIYGQTTVVKDMHTRKQLMARAVIEGGPGSGFVALSGGYGTMEELMEIVTWNQLGIHNRGVVVFNVEGYYDGLIQWVRSAVEAGFIGEGNRNIINEEKDAVDVLKALREYRVAEGRLQLKWGTQ